MNCLVLLYIARPSATACQEEKMFRSCTNEDTAVWFVALKTTLNQLCEEVYMEENKHTATIEAKLSSAKTISEALWNAETVREV